MAEAQQDGVIRRKIAAAKAQMAEGGPGADRGWRLGLARAARDRLSLSVEVTALTMQRHSLTELLELPPHQALIAVLQGPAEGLGLLILPPPVLAAMIEAQTLGKVSTSPLASRKPTRTDAAMVAPTLDAALEGLEQALVQEADLHWAGGFRYASFLDDPRPLGLLLEDIDYRVLTAELSLGLGARQGAVILALPAEGKGVMPAVAVSGPEIAAQSGLAFAQALAEQVEETACVLDAVVSRVSLPLNRVMALKVGEMIPLPRASIDRIQFEGMDGRRLTEGRLGQNRGMRAIRLTSGEVPPRKPVGIELAVVAEPLRHTG
ncbi:MAG: FliM/FliN family flagellar motor switch protein [Cypionkella sp.]